MKPLNNDIWLTVNRVWQPATEMKLSKERHLADREWVGVADPFSPEKIEELKAFFKQNASVPTYRKRDCIQTLNAGIELIFGNGILPLGMEFHEFKMHGRRH